MADPLNILDPPFSFRISGVTDRAAAAFVADMQTSRRLVKDWWGPSFQGKVEVEVHPRFKISRALLPAARGNRGKMEFPARRVTTGNAAIIHELIHVFAPNQNRFLAEGLAVYGHHVLGGCVAFPNFGRDFRPGARRLRPRVTLLALERKATPTRLRLLGRLSEGEAYILAGSFVEFLVVRYGMTRFRRLYALSPLHRGRGSAGLPARWMGIYGRSLRQLEREWRLSLNHRHQIKPTIDS